MSVPTLDSDLQLLWDGSTVLEYRQQILATQALRDNTAAMAAATATRTALIDKGVGALMDTAGSSKDELIQNIVLTLLEAYMRPSTTAQTQTDEQMMAESDRDAARLGYAAARVYRFIAAAKAEWS